MNLDHCYKCQKYVGTTLHKSGLCPQCRTRKCPKCERDYQWRKEIDKECFDCRKKPSHAQINRFIQIPAGAR